MQQYKKSKNLRVKVPKGGRRQVRPKTRPMKTLFATNMFALSLPSFSLVALLLFELSFC